MPLPETKNTRKKVARNSEAIGVLEDRDNPVFKRISKPARTHIGRTTPGIVSRAVCTADAGAGTTIAATLYASDGTTGDAITVYCSIANGSDLNEATPRLEIGLDIFVTKSTYDNAGTPEQRWYCDTVFQTTEDCTCGT